MAPDEDIEESQVPDDNYDVIIVRSHYVFGPSPFSGVVPCQSQSFALPTSYENARSDRYGGGFKDMVSE